MDIIILFKSIIGLAILLGILIVVLVVPKRLQKRNEIKKQKKLEAMQSIQEDTHSFQKLYAIVKKRTSTTEELENALNLIMKYHATMHKKLGIRSHPESDVYMDVIFKLCRHKNTNKTITIKFINNLEKANPEYKKEINDAMMRGLNSRGI